MIRFKTYIYLFILVTLSGCAQIGTLSGGEKDKEPPKYVKSNPPKQGRNFIGDKVIITFDEFFVLDNLNSVFLSSPPLLKKPDFSIKRKSLVINLNEKLKDTTTYTFLFGDAVKDFHAGNKMNDFRFVFSTGEILDTMEVSGQVRDAKTHEGQSDLFVMLYKNYTDSTPVKEKPYYIAKTDSAGKFNINFIKPGKYRIFALKDNDANLKFNLPSEKIAFVDTFIIPRVISKTNTDSLKAGTVIHTGEKDTVGDTLKQDTVIISQKYNYSPKNILLFAFIENHATQYLINKERTIKGKCIFQYSKNTNNLKIKGLNFNLDSLNSYTERQDSGRTAILWLKDKNLFQKDSLKFISSYFNKDSIDNLTLNHDTITLPFDFKPDTIKSYTTFKDGLKDIDYFKDFEIETETPILSADTNQIHLFKLIDTLVSDTKKQELLNAFRPAPDTLIFNLQRPFIKDFYPEALNFDNALAEFSETYSENNTLLTCVVSNKDISKKDTLKLVLHYDNAYFKGQIQHFSDTINLPLFKQNIISAERPTPDTLIFNFKKYLSSETTVELTKDNTNNWYRKTDTKNRNKLKIIITDKNLIQEDTLMLKIRTLDYDNTKGEKIHFEYVKNLIFKHKKQFIKTAFRPQKQIISLIFNKPLIEDIKISFPNSEKDLNNFKISYNTQKDTVNCKIINPDVYNLDTISALINYKEKYKHKIINHSDTLSIIYKHKRRKHKRHYQEKNTAKKENSETADTEKKETVSIEIPVPYKLFKDSANKRIFHISYPWKEGESYILKLDSFAVKDYYGNYSQYKTFHFKVRTKDDYGRIILSVSNIKRISDKNFYFQNDTISVDSVKYSKLPAGQLILNLYDENNILLKTEKLKQDTVLIYENIVSGTYHTEIIYDENKNNIWDTGNYLKNKQPERIIYYPNDIIIKPNWDNHIEIKIKANKFN